MRFKKLLSIIVIVVYGTTQIVFGALAESNLWSERRRQLESAAFLNQFPPAAVVALHPKWTDSNKVLSRRFSKKFQDLLNAIPPSRGSIQDVYYSGQDKTSPVVLIQDVHLNAEAQQNIATILRELINQKQTGFVGVEGAFDAFDFKPFRCYPENVRRLVSESFLKKGLMAAPSFVGIMSPTEPPPFIGIDDKTHYGLNVQSYLSSRTMKDSALRRLERIKKDLTETKRKTFGPVLLRFDGLRTAYAEGRLSIGSYVTKLAEMKTPVELPLKQFIDAYHLESTLDFDRVGRERRLIIEKLTKTLSGPVISRLFFRWRRCRTARAASDSGAYYSDLPASGM